MAKGRHEDREPLITAEQISALTAAVVAAGYDLKAGKSFKKLLSVLRGVNSDWQHQRLISALQAKRLSRPTLSGKELDASQIARLACAVTPWGAENFSKILMLVPLLTRERWGIGLARQMTGGGGRTSHLSNAHARQGTAAAA